MLFDYVRRKHQEVAVDRLCIAGAFAAAHALPERAKLAVNVQIVLESIVQVARRLGERVVGEGVQCAGELEVLRCLGVDYAQGFLVAAPQPAARFAGALLKPLLVNGATG